MLREFICRLVELTGVPLLIREVLQGRFVTILVYHRVDPVTADRHFAALRRVYAPISLQTYLVARRSGTLERLPRKSVIVTIDDGHKSVHQLASVLAEHRIPVTVFLCSGFVGTDRRFWFSAPGLQPGQRQYLKTVPDETRIEALRTLGFDHSVEFGERETLDLDEVRELQGLVDFQSHSVSHPILPACPDAKATVEIELSRRQLEESLGRPINAFAYPNGSYSEREIRITRDSGYECGLTMDPGFNAFSTSSFALKRLAVADDCGVHELMIRACGLWALLRSVRQVANRRLVSGGEKARYAGAARAGF
jgi:peptidoglycan/xylan/chitin deacetylase (PgdA/CDA1 family)